MKILRHGLDSYHPDTNEGNRAALKREVVDLLAIRYALTAKGIVDLTSGLSAGQLEEVFKRKTKYTHHQIETNPYMKGARVVDLADHELLDVYHYYRKKADACTGWGAAYAEYIRNADTLRKEIEERKLMSLPVHGDDAKQDGEQTER